MKMLPLVLVLGMVGCASAPKPEIPPDHLAFIAKQAAGVYRCGLVGNIPPATVKESVNLFGNKLAKYSYSQTEFKRLSNEALNSNTPVTREFCNEMAMLIEANREEPVAGASQQYQPIIQPNRQTYCNRIGNQTFCNSF